MPQGRQWLRQRHALGSGQSALGSQDEELAVEVGRDVQCTNYHAPDVFEGVVVEAETSLYPAIGDAALGDEAPDHLFQDLLKVHASALVRCDLRRSLMSAPTGPLSRLRLRSPPAAL